jgi:phospholipase/lecithinase/hemolysin
MRSNLPAILTVILIAPLSSALAGPITQIVVFGDSLSDNGNAAALEGGTIPGNYASNAYTDGPNTNPPTAGPYGLWIDQFAALAGLPDPQPFLAAPGGTNYAIASAQTGSTNPQDISNQVAGFSAANGFSVPSDALYVIWGGANDLFDGTDGGATAANNLAADIQALASEGAEDFLWLNLPQLGDTPLGSSSGPTDAAILNAQSTAFDSQWASDISTLNSTGLDVIGVDVNSLFNDILGNPGQYGFTNVTSPAQGTSGNPNDYLFWDEEHPTTAGDALVAQLAYSDFIATPEPASLWMLLGGAAGFLLLSRRRQDRAKRSCELGLQSAKAA